jgi:hypothetical protein
MSPFQVSVSMKVARVLAVVAAIGATGGLAGCEPFSSLTYTVPEVSWYRAGVGYDQFVADRHACVLYARSTVSRGSVFGNVKQSADIVPESTYVPCMRSKGYKQDPEGFKAPPDDPILMSPDS